MACLLSEVQNNVSETVDEQINGILSHKCEAYLQVNLVSLGFKTEFV